MLRRAIVTLAVLASAVPAAGADSGSVALVSPDPALVDAARTALVPWRIRVVTVQEPNPGADMPIAAERARDIASAHRVGAVVWLSESDGAHALWMYDIDDDRTVARRLTSPPPFDAAGAAAVALSIKTLLRHSAVAPPMERYAAKTIRRAARTPTRLHFESTVGVRLRSGGGAPESRLGLGASWWPTQRFAAGVLLRSGPGMAVDEPTFVGRFSDVVLGLSGRMRFGIAPHLALAPEAVLALHITDLDGAVLAVDERAHIRRINPAAELGVTAEWDVLDELSVGFRVGGAYLVRKQRYLVLGEPVYELPSTEWSAALVLRTRLH